MYHGQSLYRLTGQRAASPVVPARPALPCLAPNPSKTSERKWDKAAPWRDPARTPPGPRQDPRLPSRPSLRPGSSEPRPGIAQGPRGGRTGRALVPWDGSDGRLLPLHEVPTASSVEPATRQALHFTVWRVRAKMSPMTNRGNRAQRRRQPACTKSASGSFALRPANPSPTARKTRKTRIQNNNKKKSSARRRPAVQAVQQGQLPTRAALLRSTHSRCRPCPRRHFPEGTGTHRRCLKGTTSLLLAANLGREHYSPPRPRSLRPAWAGERRRPGAGLSMLSMLSCDPGAAHG